MATNSAGSAPVIPKALQNASERLKDEVREASHQVKQDAKNIQQWAIETATVVGQLYVAGVRDSFMWLMPSQYQGSNANQYSKSLGSREFQLTLLRFCGFLFALLFAKDYLAPWMYWPLIIYFNEALNYYIVTFQYAGTLSATASDAKDKIIDLKDNVAHSTSNISRSISGLLKRATSSSDTTADSSSSAASGEDETRSRKRRRKARSLILARVIVAKILSYCLIYAYLQEIVDLINLMDLPVTALLFAFFIGENRLLIFKNLTNFTDRVEYIKSYLVYMLGYGTFMAIVFEHAPYGEYWCSLLHLAALLVPAEPKTDKRVDFDVIKLAEIVCFRIVEYVI